MQPPTCAIELENMPMPNIVEAGGCPSYRSSSFSFRISNTAMSTPAYGKMPIMDGVIPGGDRTGGSAQVRTVHTGLAGSQAKCLASCVCHGASLPICQRGVPHMQLAPHRCGATCNCFVQLTALQLCPGGTDGHQQVAGYNQYPMCWLLADAMFCPCLLLQQLLDALNPGFSPEPGGHVPPCQLHRAGHFPATRSTQPATFIQHPYPCPAPSPKMPRPSPHLDRTP